MTELGATTSPAAHPSSWVSLEKKVGRTMNDQRLVFSHHRYLLFDWCYMPLLDPFIPCLCLYTSLPLIYMIIMADRSLSLHALMGLFLDTWISEDVKIFVDLFSQCWPSMMALRILEAFFVVLFQRYLGKSSGSSTYR